MKIILQEEILKLNEEQADINRELFRKKKVFAFNLISSPGAGKTTILCNLIRLLSEEFRIAVVEGDLYTARDAERVEKVCPVVSQINTSGACHIEADTISRAITDFDLDKIDILFIENVGNLVCPAEFDLGEDEVITILSVVEGEDKPAKYPLAFTKASAIVINKADLLPYVNVGITTLKEEIFRINAHAEQFVLSSIDVRGYDDLLDYIRGRVREKIQG